MKRFLKSTALVAGSILSVLQVQAGNPDRIGQAGSTQLLINGWAASSGLNGSNTANVRGIEATFLNVAGLAHTAGTEIVFARTNWLAPSGSYINNLGLAQRVSDQGVLGLTVGAMGFGDLEITTTEQPDGGLGTFRPQFINLGISYGHTFSENITGGVTVRAISENAVNVRAQGFALDAGVMWKTSTKKASESIKRDDLKFGVSLKNIGPPMRYNGDGISQKSRIPGSKYDLTLEQRTDRFEIPSLLNIGASYDMKLDKGNETYFNRLTASFNFVSNTFSRNIVSLGLEYSWKDIVMLRGGYNFERGAFDDILRTNALSGFAAGASFQLPLSKGSKNIIAVDYSFRSAYVFSGTHSFGLRMSLGND